MKITLREWIELYQLAKETADCRGELEHRLVQLQIAHHKAGNTEETLLLAKLLARDDACPYMYVPQDEWTGGPSDDPRNHTLREPNWVHIGHRFPREQVDEFRDEDGNIHFPAFRDGEVLYDSVWDEHAEYPAKDWQYEVGNGDTRLGYWDWVEHQKESNAE